MTIDEFNSTQWKPGMRGCYKGGLVYPIACCDFEEQLIGLDGLTLGSEEPTMVRCENVELVTD